MTIKASSYPTSRPTLDLNFAQTKRLDPRVTFTRSSTGSYSDANGVLQSAATNTARFDHNPATGESLGLLVEESRTNILTYSNEFTNAAWTKSSSTVTPNSALAPDGTFTASKLVEDTSTANHYIGRSVIQNTYKTATVYAKAAERSWVAMYYYDTSRGVSAAAIFNLSSGTISRSPNCDSSIEVLTNGWFRLRMGRQANAGAAFYISILQGDVVPDYSGTTYSYTGNGSSGVYIWGAQVEDSVTFPTSYIPTPATFTSRASSATYYDASGTVQTAGTNVARSAAFFPDSNGVMRPAGLLLEAAGTNLLLRSQEIDNVATWAGSYKLNYSANATTAPDGTATADKVIPNTENVSHSTTQDPAGTISGTYTFSLYAKASGYNKIYLWIDGASAGGLFGSGSALFDLSTKAITNVSGSAAIETLPNGWYRCSVTGTSASAVTVSTGFGIYDNSGNSTFIGNGTDGIFVWGAQLEASPYPTSYIATTTATVTRSADVSSSATVTRSADVASITGTNFSSWYNQSEGSVFADITDLGYPANIQGSLWKIFASTSHTSGRNAISLYRYSGGTLPEARFSVVDQNAATVVDLNTPTSPTRARVKSAIGLKSASYAATSHGNTAVTSSTAVPPTYVAADTLAFGQATNSTSQAKSCLISRLAYWPTRLSDATLQAITL